MSAIITLAEHRARMREGLHVVNVEVRALVDRLTPSQLVRQPSPEQWSVAHCLDHLAVTNARYREQALPVLARAGERNAANDALPYRTHWLARWLMRMTGPEGKRHLPAPKVFRPAPRPPADAVDRFFAEQAWLDRTLAGLDGVDINALRIVSPATPLMRFTLAESFAVILGHEQRHLAQAQRAARAGV